MATKPVKRLWTVEEYLAYELETGIRHEFINGEIYAMTGGTDNHSRIKVNVVGELHQQLKNSKTCLPYDSDMRIKITDLIYVYPDMSVVCGKPVFSDKKRSMLTNPTFVLEVLSETSADYDKGQKMEYYQSLPSVQAYLMLEQDKASTILYTRNEAGWQLTRFNGLEAIVPLASIGCNLALSEAYFNINFEEDTEEE